MVQTLEKSLGTGTEGKGVAVIVVISKWDCSGHKTPCRTQKIPAARASLEMLKPSSKGFLNKEFKPSSVQLELLSRVFTAPLLGLCGCRFFRFLVDPKPLKPRITGIYHPSGSSIKCIFPSE